ncbi:gluconate 2-dehydrogenase subunit 3 family protein [Maribacter polysiphoniae]|uniref:Gluconate 2-dehydrogenase subunit 3 family protein n=1 Tax=Maribacter polysiphoniae TaxID=429344 RepID=A0A316DVJ7_9FLAO|nr:gluconate 2-dehydrogenase subunit 3 family protein [Maribacter polysiphoniae]MBD1262268.1 gluconate 2-dehydrogenase subunit 3 family protein [Maribacter polysiphoniae]PWK21468.1 gluconate 2-dehydrogenase subunit 3-like protein [Maribacter polysiphoniae]
MDRRKSIQAIILGAGAGATGLIFKGCKTDEGPTVEENIASGAEEFFGRTPEELKLIEKLNAEQLFNTHEMETIAVLSTVILPPKEPHGGPIEAEVPEFIEFIAKDYPEMQDTLLGGLMWLDHTCNTTFGIEFKSATLEQQKQILDTIAFHDVEVPLEDQPMEIQFFHMMRGLTVTGYYTSKVGIADLGYKGNMPNVWDGVPEDVLEQHGVSYDPEWIAKCVDQSKRGIIAEWDEEGNLLT